MTVKAKKTVRKKAARTRTSVTRKKSGKVTSRKESEGVEGEVLEVGPLCNVGLGMKRTWNLGEFESLSAEVSIHIPCENEEVDEAFDLAKGWVMGKLTDLQEELIPEEG